MLPVAILAGGLATRLHPITETTPKSLVEVAGKPFIVRQLSYLRYQGVRRVVLCIGYLGDIIEDVVGNGSQFGMEVSYSSDGPVLLGTGGAIKKALPMLGDEFFILYGDSFLPIDFRVVEQAYWTSGLSALMTVLNNGDQWDKSNVLFSNGKLLEYNKNASHSDMTYIDYGLGVISARALKTYPAALPFDLADVYRTLSMQGQLAGLEVHERFYEIGSPRGLEETEAYFLTKKKA